MDLDLNLLAPLLRSLGPWGWVAAAVIGLIQFRRAQRRTPAVPSAPNAPPSPETPQPAPGPTGRPILDELLRLLRDRPRLAPRTFGEVTAQEAAPGNSSLTELHAAVQRAVKSRREELTAELAALPPTE